MKPRGAYLSSCLTYCTWRDTLSVPSCWDKGQVVDSEEPSCCSHGGGSGGAPSPQPPPSPWSPRDGPPTGGRPLAAVTRGSLRVGGGRLPWACCPRPSPWRRACQSPAHLGRRPPLLCAGGLGPRAHLPSSASVQVLGGASAAQTLQADVARLFLFPLYPRRHISKKYHQERRQSLLPPAAVPGPRPPPADLNPRCLPRAVGSRPGQASLFARTCRRPAPPPEAQPRAARSAAEPRPWAQVPCWAPACALAPAAPGGAGRSPPGLCRALSCQAARSLQFPPEGFLGYLRSFVGPCKLWVLCPSSARSAAGALTGAPTGRLGGLGARPAAPFCARSSLGAPVLCTCRSFAPG